MTWNRLDRRALTLFYVQALLRLALFWVPATAVGAIALSSAWEVKGALIVAAAWLLLQTVLTLWMPSLAWERWAWVVREGDLLIGHGVVFRSITAIPLQRVQHVDLRQGPVEQSLGLARLAIYTASGSGADGVLPGLALAEAEALRDRLVRVRGDDGV